MQIHLAKQKQDREAKLLEQGVRRSKRIASRDSDNISIGNTIDFETNEVNHKIIPNNFNEAKESKDWLDWHNAMIDKLESLNSHRIWKIIDRLLNVKTIKSKWIYSVKNGNNSKVRRYKARLIATGFIQIKHRDYEVSYSPVINIEPWRTLLSIAAKRNMRRFFDSLRISMDLLMKQYTWNPRFFFEKMIGPNKNM